MTPISSWGRLDAQPHQLIRLGDPARVAELLKQHRPGIAHGMGRSYGDVCLNPGGVLWHTIGLDHLIRFDGSTGRLVCESGVLLKDIQQLMVPRGWMIPVTPGTLLVTVGGAIANDVHGKNHHLFGTFGDHVSRISLVRTDGTTIECSPQLNPDWFAATVGGLGLTGVIIEAEIQLRRVSGSWLTTETIPFDNLRDFFVLTDCSESDWEHTVAWIDCINKNGRGLFMRGNPSSDDRPSPSSSRTMQVPFTPPFSLVNHFTLRPFNAAYFQLKKRRAGQMQSHYESFLYPLDHLQAWNRMYGPRGFFQYQAVIPRPVGEAAVQTMINEISRLGEGSFLAVLKTFGNRQSPGMMSFPQPGVTLALDFPNRGKKTHQLFSRLDAIVREASGRTYLAKDARSPRDLFEAGYPRLNEFLKYRDSGISSALSRRLIGS